uniref:dihydropyrimidinase n=1 Tax=Ornithodoros turicata TaxID=34597 RepID=A0A2R5L4B8_9ACAR
MSSQTRLLIRGGRVVNDDAMTEADVFVEDGVIKQVGKDISPPGGTRTIEAKGMFVMPGGIDTHTHMEFFFMNTRSADDFYTGTKSALAGGTTMIIDFVTKKSSHMTLLEAFEDYRSRADERACCDYGLSVILTDFNEEVFKEMEVLTKDKGVNSFKAFMAYKGSLMLEDEKLIKAFKACSRLGALARVHAENGDIIYENQNRLLCQEVTGPEGHLLSRDEEIEAEATHRAIVLANQVNCPLYVVHVMSRGSAEVILRKRAEGCIVFGEPTGSGLGTDGTHHFSRCWRHAAAHVMSPPLRPDPTTKTYLMGLLASGDLQTTGSDHATFTSAQKAIGADDFTKIPNGVNGVEERMGVIWQNGVNTGRMDPCKFVAVTSANAAKIFNIYPRKGRIQVGSDADIVVWDPEKERTFSVDTHHSSCDFNIFEGFRCQGAPAFVISQGKVVVEGDELQVSQGVGRFIPMAPNCPYVYAAMRQREALPPLKVDRTPYTANETNAVDEANEQLMSPAEAQPTQASRDAPVYHNYMEPLFPAQPREFHSRPLTRGGCRNLQDSSFSLSGAQIDDEKGTRKAIRVNNPPGGRSSGIW